MQYIRKEIACFAEQIGQRFVIIDYLSNCKSVIFQHSALFWYNLLRSGDGDMRTRHAACPVLIGSKWVANKWIHERGQEFRRACARERHYQERYVGDFGGPDLRYAYNIKS